MEENKEGTQQAAQEAYVRQLAELSARVLHMTEEQKQRNAAKIEELNKRVAALPPALRGLYAQKLRSLAPEAPAPQAAPVQQPPAADAAYEPEYADAHRLLNFLRFFRTVDDDSAIANNSIIREFIGGSVFVD